MEIQTLNINYGNMWKLHVFFSVNKDMNIWYNKEGDSREGSDTFTSSTNYHGIENLWSAW